MSVCYWMNEGIGIRSSSIWDHLDPVKCAKIVASEIDEEVDPSSFDIDDYMYGNPFENLGDFLCHVDDSGVMTYGDDVESESYFLYTPSFPWERSNNDPESIEDVCRIIINAVKQITNLSDNQIRDLIDKDIYDVGIG